jgi:two-component system response regulator WspF
MRIAIVNDLPLAAEVLRRVVFRLPDCDIAWMVRNGAEAVRRCSLDKPDLILMDLLMPVMDGVEATRQIMINDPCAILIVTSTVAGNAGKVVEALAFGAIDAVETPTMEAGEYSVSNLALVRKIEAIRKFVAENERRKPIGVASHVSATHAPLIAIGASAGGPGALATILKSLPEDFAAAIIVVQHIDAQFAPPLAEWLNEQSPLTVRVACEGDEPRRGTVLVASSNDHLVFKNSNKLGYTAEPSDSHYRPSIDVFFESVAHQRRGPVTGILLTGMGRDGAQGLKRLQQANALTIAQDAASCVVFGMPRAAIEIGAAKEILPLHSIASFLMQLVVAPPVPASPGGAGNRRHGPPQAKPEVGHLGVRKTRV